MQSPSPLNTARYLQNGPMQDLKTQRPRVQIRTPEAQYE